MSRENIFDNMRISVILVDLGVKALIGVNGIPLNKVTTSYFVIWFRSTYRDDGG